MVRALILYFLNIKPTHGYEIQKYIALSHLNDWTKIQSGSIYYALSKLEKLGLITLIREEGVGQKARRIYDITDKGRLELEHLLIAELKKPIYNHKSDKFIAYPFVAGIKKDTMIKVIRNHVKELEDQKISLVKWQEYKINEDSLNIEKISFEMMISCLKYQIKWHEALIEEIERCIDISLNINKFIKSMDFSEVGSLDIDEVQKNINQ